MEFNAFVLIVRKKNTEPLPEIFSLNRRAGKWEKVRISSGKRQYFQMVEEFCEK